MLDPSLYSQSRIINISQNEVLPGTKIRANYVAGHLPSGTRISIQMEIFRGENPGPHVLLVGGVHGDEINGVEIARKSIQSQMFQELKCGSVIVIPLLNVYGFINYSRDVPDGKDVNRSFPGRLKGSMASRVAGILSRHILPQVDVVIDFHTGTQYRYNYPQIRITQNDALSFELAKAFNPPFIIHKGQLKGSLRKTSLMANKPCLIYEGGEALRFDEFAIHRGLAGVQNLMQQLGMINGNQPLPPAFQEIRRTSWIRASASGLFVWHKSSGKPIVKGEPLATIGDPYGNKKVSIEANRDGFIIGHSNAAVVNQGDALFHIGYN
jgi:predicted deacylase